MNNVGRLTKDNFNTEQINPALVLAESNAYQPNKRTTVYNDQNLHISALRPPGTSGGRLSGIVEDPKNLPFIGGKQKTLHMPNVTQQQFIKNDDLAVDREELGSRGGEKRSQPNQGGSRREKTRQYAKYPTGFVPTEEGEFDEED